MSKIKTQFSCHHCGTMTPKWSGRCPGCGEWDSLIEETVASVSKQVSGSQTNTFLSSLERLHPSPMESSEHNQPQENHEKRYFTGLQELDRVLGGGLVFDSFVLLGGDPGIGKSTILLQMLHGVLAHASQQGMKALYVSGEESITQIRARTQRLNSAQHAEIYLATTTDLEQVLEGVQTLKPDILIMDSLQTFCSQKLSATPGSVSQVKEVANTLMKLAKTQPCCVWLVGHVTKEGNIAGPKMVEHMVDTVLYFEGEGGQNVRLLRAVKNRFGSARELGVFEMTSRGLMQVQNPSSLFLADRKNALAGTAVCVPMEGSRALLVECQALANFTYMPMARRTSVGMDSVRIAMLCAVLEKHAGLKLSDQDLFFNVAGGIKIADPACDLAAGVAIWSSLMNHIVPSKTVFIGELGLTGEVRKVADTWIRIEEAFRLGFEIGYVPASALKEAIFLSEVKKKWLDTSSERKIIPIRQVSDLPRALGWI